MTGKVIFHTTMSLDGFTTGPGGAMDWMFVDGDPGPAGDEVVERAGALLVGRRSWEGTESHADSPGTAKPYGGRWSGPIIVLTHRPEDEPDDPDVSFVSGDLGAALGQAIAAAAPKDVVLFGADLARQCLRLGRVDEVIVHIVPVLLGDGTPFFREAGGAAVGLELIESYRSGQIVTMRLHPS